MEVENEDGLRRLGGCAVTVSEGRFFGLGRGACEG